MKSPRSPRILIVSLAAGAGHVQAAKALVKTAAADFPDVVTAHLEMSELIHPLFRSGLVDSYHSLAKYSPALWGLFYKTSNHKNVPHILKNLMGPTRFSIAGPLYEAAAEFRPDHIICTNGFPAYLLASPPAKVGPLAPVSVVATDYTLHWYWLPTDMHTYFVPHESLRTEILASTPADADRIVVSGIPVDPIFYEKFDRARLAKEFGLPPDKKMVLVLAGGEGLIDTTEIVEKLASLSEPLTIIAIAGKNLALKKKLDRLTVSSPHTLIVRGWVDTMHSYIKLADVVVSKPGGLTTTECLVLGRPLIAVNAIPGQEIGNSDFIVKHKLGVAAEDPADVAAAVKKLFEKSLRPDHVAPQSPAAHTILAHVVN